MSAGHAEVRRSRRLVLSFISTVVNYEYAFYWYFYQVTLCTALCLVLISLLGFQGTLLFVGNWRSDDTLNAQSLGHHLVKIDCSNDTLNVQCLGYHTQELVLNPKQN